MVGSVVSLHVLLDPYWCVCLCVCVCVCVRVWCTVRNETATDLIKYAATSPNQLQRCTLTDYFNNYNFSKALIIRSLMMVIEPKHVGAVLM